VLVSVPPELPRPEIVMTRPSPRVVVDAYQRPLAMPCDCTNSAVPGSKMEARLSPVNV